LNVSVKTPRPVREIHLVPEVAPLTFNKEASYVSFQIPRIDGHAMISLTF
jgi:hypothetical protein